MLTGDFNLRQINWSNNTVGGNGQGKVLIDLLNDSFLTQLSKHQLVLTLKLEKAIFWTSFSAATRTALTNLLSGKYSLITAY